MFIGIFKDTGSVLSESKAPEDALDGCTVLLAYYEYEDYSGSAFVLYQDAEGKLFEVNGGHCSCYGLEEQWDAEETSVAALRHHLTNGQLGRAYGNRNEFADELTTVLNELEQRA